MALDLPGVDRRLELVHELAPLLEGQVAAAEAVDEVHDPRPPRGVEERRAHLVEDRAAEGPEGVGAVEHPDELEVPEGRRELSLEDGRRLLRRLAAAAAGERLESHYDYLQVRE